MQTIWKTDPIYPPLLREAHKSPERLFALGKQLNPKDRYFSIVGTRHPSTYGKQMASEFTSALASSGFVIVSGLAYGIDAIAHRAALDAGGRTIAVLGSGFNHLAYHTNRELAEKIQKTGCLITEFEPDVRPNKTTFPQRNRIIAGMSVATLVIEAPEKSGALITARLALEYSREVFALPANITQETSRGTNQLLRDSKAFPVTCIQDIFDALKTPRSNSQVPSSSPTPVLSADEETIYKILQQSPQSIDGIVLITQFPVSRVNTLVSLLELKGLIYFSGSYALITR